MKTKLIGTGTAIVLAGAVGFGPGAMPASASPTVKTGVAAAQPAQMTLPVIGTLPGGVVFTGALSNLTTSFGAGVVTLSGTITGTGLPAGGTAFTAPIQDITTDAGCSILNLDLGPLNLDLLGLVIDLSAISLDVTAVPGAGNLLGNLLCAVAGLLDDPGNALAAFSPAWASDPAERRLRRGGPTAGVAGAFPCTTGVPAMPCRHRPDVPTWRS